MKKILFLFPLVITLASCSTNMPKQVDIPVAVKQPAPNIPPKPLLPIAKLKKDSKPNEVIKAYASSVVILQGYSDQLINILEAYQ